MKLFRDMENSVIKLNTCILLCLMNESSEKYAMNVSYASRYHGVLTKNCVDVPHTLKNGQRTCQNHVRERLLFHLIKFIQSQRLVDPPSEVSE